MEMDVPGQRRRERPKYRWEDKLKVNMQEKNLEHRMWDRHECQSQARNSDPI